MNTVARSPGHGIGALYVPFESSITIKFKGKQYRAMKVLLADLNCGDTFMIEAIGTDAIEAVERIAQLVQSLKDWEEKAGSTPNPHGRHRRLNLMNRVQEAILRERLRIGKNFF